MRLFYLKSQIKKYLKKRCVGVSFLFPADFLLTKYAMEGVRSSSCGKGVS